MTTDQTTDPTLDPKNGHHLHTGHPLSERTIRALAAAHLGAFDVLRVLEMALEEDLHTGFDVTSVATIAPTSVSSADVVIRKDGVFGGAPLITAALEWFIGDRVQCKVFFAPAPNRIFFKCAHTGCGFAGVSDFGVGTCNRIDPCPGKCRSSADTTN